MTHYFDIIGDDITLDRRLVASIAHLDPGFRALVREQLAALLDAVAEPEPLDLSGCDVVTIVLDDDLNLVGRYFPGPPLPTGWQTFPMIYLHEIESAAEDIIEIQKPDIEVEQPKKRKRKK